MPKRKMTPARQAQIIRWQMAGTAARKTREWKASQPKPINNKVPNGKVRLLIHHTNSNAAAQIVKQRKWKPGNYANGAVYFSDPSKHHEFAGYGKAIVGVRVPRKLVKERRPGRQFRDAKDILPELHVDAKHLTGRKVTRYK